MNRESLIADFSPFVDIGSEAPRITTQKNKFTVKFVRNGKDLKIILNCETGRVSAGFSGATTFEFASISALLASDLFANLRKWADVQVEVVKKKISDSKKIIPFNIKNQNGEKLRDISSVSLNIVPLGKPDSVKILVIDGPAGIGKTFLTHSLALSRAEGYRQNALPLILHVESRGRVLSNLTDLIAFSLQTLRVPIMYDQVPVLVRHGLVVIAIDGFDELGDPNGYDMAWAQLSEFISSVRGRGVLVLAGRDTFLSRERILSNISSLRADVDEVDAITLDVPSASTAIDWLKKRPNSKWSDSSFDIPAVAALFEDNSFALRPFFLSFLSDNVSPKELKDKHQEYLTRILLDGLIERESKLFGKAVEAVIDRNTLKGFINRLLMEISREMADTQSESLDSTTISWIAEYTLGGDFPADIVGLIKNRAVVMAPLVVDERPGFRSFVHSHIKNYYLSKATIDSIGQGELPKYIRRNIFGSEFLQVFVDAISECARAERSRLQNFFVRASGFAQQHSIDRSSRNLGALLFASIHEASEADKLYFSGFQVDDAVVRGTSGPVQISAVVINQLDARRADIEAMEFSGCTVVSLIADEGSRFSPTIPLPLSLVNGRNELITDANKIKSWIDIRGRSMPIVASIASEKVRAHPVYALLGRVCRTRLYWLREGDDEVRVLINEHWPKLRGVLMQCGFLRIDKRQASGQSANFIHVKQPERILAEDPSDADVVRLFSELDKVV